MKAKIRVFFSIAVLLIALSGCTNIGGSIGSAVNTITDKQPESIQSTADKVSTAKISAIITQNGQIPVQNATAKLYLESVLVNQKQTNGSGTAVFTQISAPGTYRLQILMDGFQTNESFVTITSENIASKAAIIAKIQLN